MQAKIKVVITMGDPSGCGPSLIAGSLRKMPRGAKISVVCDEWLLKKSLRGKNFKNLELIDLKNVPHNAFRRGIVSAEYGRASLDYLDRACLMIKSGDSDCLVTAPVSKEALNLSGCSFSGQTEYLAAKFNKREVEMMLENNKLKFVLATRHIPLSMVSNSISIKRISDVAIKTERYLKDAFLIKSPKLCVMAINPHASDNGLIGNEEEKILMPALDIAASKGVNICGPLPADTAVKNALGGSYDCLIAAYHDQALIPLKATGFDSGVNISLGLGFMRTSPLHGVAFDKAASYGKLNFFPFLNAVHRAIECTRNLKRG